MLSPPLGEAGVALLWLKFILAGILKMVSHGTSFVFLNSVLFALLVVSASTTLERWSLELLLGEW